MGIRVLPQIKSDRRSFWRNGARVARNSAALLLLATLGAGSVRAGNNVWTAIGPFGGGARALAIDPGNPSTVYVGTSGGVFRTSNGGANWVAANSGLPAGYVAHSLVIDPQGPNTVYAGGACGTYGHCGIFKSTDSGANWSPINSGLEDSVIVVESLAIDPQNPGTIYAGTSACFQTSGTPGFVPGTENLCNRPGVFKTTNGGASWTGASSGLPWASVTFGSIGALAVDPQAPSTVYAGTAGGVFKTTNGGISWSATNSSLPCCYAATALVIDAQNPRTLFAAGYGIVKTTDGGANWSAVSPVLSADCCGSLAIDPQNPNTIYAGGRYGVFRTTDGGEHWSATNPTPPGVVEASLGIFPGATAGLAVDPQNPGTVYAATGGLGVFKSTDGASSWNPMNSGLSATEVHSSAIDSRNPGTIYAATNGGLFKTIDGGVSWSGANSGLPAGGFPVSIAIDPQIPSTLYAGINGNLGTTGYGQSPAGIFKSVDGGASWISVSSAVETGYFTASLAIDPHNPSTLYAGGLNPNHGPVFDEILESADGGTSWTATGSFPNYLGAVVIDSQSPSNLYAVTAGSIFKSTDGGASWMDLRVPTDSVGDCDCLAIGVLAVDPQRPDTLYAAGAVGVLKSTDGGASWNAMNSGLPKASTDVGALVIDPRNSNTVYATMDGQVFKSTDGAATWSGVNAGLTVTWVNNLAIDPQNPSTVYAGTAGGGIFAITFAPAVPDPWQQAITALKIAAGTDSYNFWQWDWLWQRTPSFPGAPASFGVLGSIDNTPGMMGEIIAAGGGNGIQNISAEQWVAYYQVAATDPWQQAIARMQASAGTDSYNFWQWAWFWQRSPMFAGAPAGFGVLGSIDNTPGAIGNIIAAGGGNGFAVVSAQQWVLYYRQAASQ